jgi:hypothetical protein
MCINFLLFHCFHFRLAFESIKELASASHSPFLSIFDYALTLIHPIMTLIIKVSHKRLSKIHTCHHRMIPISKLNMLNCSTLGFRVCLFGQSSPLESLYPKGQLGIITINLVIYMPPSPPLSMYFGKLLPLSFFLFAFMILERGIIMSNELQ